MFLRILATIHSFNRTVQWSNLANTLSFSALRNTSHHETNLLSKQLYFQSSNYNEIHESSCLKQLLFCRKIFFRVSSCLEQLLLSYNYFFNLGQNICRLFPVLAQCFFTTSKTELNYYHQKVNIRVASIGNFKKIAETHGFDGVYSADHPTAKFWHFSVKLFQKISCKTFHRKT